MPDYQSQFAVAITAQDKTAPGIRQAQKSFADGLKKPAGGAREEVEKTEKSMAGFATRMRDFWHTSGLGRAVEQSREIGRSFGEARDHVEKLARVAGPLEGLVGLGSLAGIGLAIERYARGTAELTRTAGTIGIAPESLHQFRGAASLAGLAPEAATGALQNTATAMYQARAGLNPMAAGVAQQFGLNLAATPENFLRQFADKLKGQSAPVQMRMAEAFGVTEMLPILRQGSAELDRFLQAAERFRHLTHAQIEAGEQLHTAYAEATQATLGFADALSATLAPKIKPLLDEYTNWITSVKESPAAMSVAVTGAGALATVVGITLVTAIGKAAAATLRFNKVWYASPLGVLGIIGLAAYEFGDHFMRKAEEKGEHVETWTKPSDARRWPQTENMNNADPGILSGVGKWFRGLFHGGSAGATPGGAPLEKQSLTNDPATDAALRVINKYESPKGDVWNYLHDTRPSYYTAGGYWQVTDGNWRSYGARLGIDLNKYPHAQGSPRELQAAVAGLMYKEQGFTPWDNAHGGAMSPARIDEAKASARAAAAGGGAGPGTQDILRDRSAEPAVLGGPRSPWQSFKTSASSLTTNAASLIVDAERGTREMLAGGKLPPGYPAPVATPADAPAPAPAQARPAVAGSLGDYRSPYSAVGQPGVKVNSKGQPYSAELDTMSAQDKANVAASMKTIHDATFGGGGSWYKTQPVDDATSHEVTIHIPNAPPGTRAEMTRSEGPAKTGVRIEYAMPP